MTTLELLKPALEPAARAALIDRLCEDDIHALVDEAFEFMLSEYLSTDGEGVGGTLMLRLASLTAGFYQGLFLRVGDAAEARALTGEVTWRIYSKAGRLPWSLGGVGATSKVDRLRRATDVFRRFPFSPPAYEMVDVHSDDPAVVAFDVLRCPVAEYFVERGLGEVCVETWCNLDFPLAEQWGARLERDTQLASGDKRCEFRWHAEV